MFGFPVASQPVFTDRYGNPLTKLKTSGGTALTNPMTTAGDLIVGGSGGTPTRLGIGSNGQVPTVSGGALVFATPAASGIPSGTSFPGSPATNTIFFRTDLGMPFYYDGTRWLSWGAPLKFRLGFYKSASSQPFSATVSDAMMNTAPFTGGGSDIWLINHRVCFLVNGGGSALNGSNKWVGNLHKYDTALTSTTIATINIDSGSSGVARMIDTTINALLDNGTPHFFIETDWTRTGSPGSIYTAEEIAYRIVAV